MVNYGKLRAGVDYFIKDLNLIIHQPSYKELMDVLTDGERQLYVFANIISTTVQEAVNNNLIQASEEQIKQLSDFHILLLFLSDNKNKRSFLNILYLLFPSATNISVMEEEILVKYSINDVELEGRIDQFNYGVFKENINAIFPILKNVKGETYNTTGKIAEEIKNKLLKGRERSSNQKQGEEKENIDIFGRYCLILSIGKTFNYEDLIGMTIFNILQLYEAYSHEREFIDYREQLFAGVKDATPVKDWVVYTDLDYKED